LASNQRANNAHDKSNENNAPRRTNAIHAVHHICDKERKRVGKGTPRKQPIKDEELHKDVRRHHNDGHGENAWKYFGHFINPF
jgi:hypothetical protein